MTKQQVTRFFESDKNLYRLIRTRMAFFEFLTEHEACEFYFANAGNTASKSPTDWIFCAFNWEDTPQGWLFWSQLHGAWCDQLKDKLTDKEVYL